MVTELKPNKRAPFCRETAIMRHKQGWTHKQIAEEQGYGPTKVYSTLRDVGLAIDVNQRREQRVRKANDICARISAGEKISDIAQDLGVTDVRIRQLIAVILPQAPRTDLWSFEKEKTLRELWLTKLSTLQIGKRLGMSKNAVIGKAQGLELNARPNPIKIGCKKPPKINMKNKPVITPEGRFPSITAAARYFGLSEPGAWYRVKKGIKGWKFEIHA